MARVMSSLRWNGRQAGLAGLLALALLLGSLAAGPSAHADGPAAVFQGFVVAETGGVLPSRIRAFSEHGIVCGSGDVVKLGASSAGIYSVTVVSGTTKAGCPMPGEGVRIAMVYGLVDDDVFVGPVQVFTPGTTTNAHLVRSASDVGGAILLP